MRRFLKTKSFNMWGLLSAVFIFTILLPNVDMLKHLFAEPTANWEHIKTYLLKEYITNSLVLALTVGVITALLGTTLAWLVTAFEFPGRRFFNWSLILPLTIPPYIGAYTYSGLLSYTGGVQSFLRNVLELKLNPAYFDLMSLKGAVFIFAVFLFPYVYMVTKAFLEKQSASLIENARLLGRNSAGIFFDVVLPISRGAIVGGTALVIMELLNDYGVVKYFGIPTFSTAIFTAWFSMGDVESAVRLAAYLMVIVFGVLLAEKWLRGRKKYSFSNSKARPLARRKLTGIPAFLAFLACFTTLSFGFLIPTLQLIFWSLLSYKKILNLQFFEMIFNSVWVAAVASVLIIIVAVIIANYCRISNGRLARLFSKAALIGYSIPAAVIAIGVILLFVDLDRNLLWLYQLIDSDSKTLVLSTGIAMLIFAYIVRFLAIAYQSVEAGFEKVGKTYYEASRTLGESITGTFFRVDLQMLKPALLSGFALVFVDIIKELPLTLLLRPFNFHTLATKSFEYANDEMIHEAAVASLIIILVSICSVYLINRIGNKE